MTDRVSYHHGDLRAALVEAALALIAERGIDALSVAEAARRTGVSPAAPYRHFPTRLALLNAAATRAAELLAAELGTALAEAPADPGEALARTAAVYVRFVVRHHAGFDLIFAKQLRPLADPALGDAGRAVMDVLLPIAHDLTGDAQAALVLLQQHIGAAHGYAVLHLSGFMSRFSSEVDDVAERAADASKALAAAARSSSTRSATAAATPSSGASASSNTGEGRPPATTATPATTSEHSSSLPCSPGFHDPANTS